MLAEMMEKEYGGQVSGELRHQSQQARVDNDVPPASCLMEEGDDTAS